MCVCVCVCVCVCGCARAGSIQDRAFVVRKICNRWSTRQWDQLKCDSSDTVVMDPAKNCAASVVFVGQACLHNWIHRLLIEVNVIFCDELNKERLFSCLPRASMIIKHFIIQLMHNIYIYVGTIKIIKYLSVPTCFGSQRIHHQGALYSAWLKITRMVLSCPLTWTNKIEFSGHLRVCTVHQR